MRARDICLRAADLVGVSVRRQHGQARIAHTRIAALWSAYLDHPISAHDVAILMILLKVARTKNGNHQLR